MASSKREQLLSTAQVLFAREGYHATGIDRILAESGVAKMTLYKHFRSKEELILAVLERRERETLEGLALLRASCEPREALLRTFDALQLWIHQADFCGCSFIHAAAEFHDREHPIHQRAATFKAAVFGHFHMLLQVVDPARAEQLAWQLMFLLEGALSIAHVQGPADQALHARAAAEALLGAR
ncbi:TetR/AcrR family transcriptional regulator [Aquipseudomonas alcaligenes]|uniref:Transcriptional regulator, TetR family n=1 Tax=Aquipseudomonas alcaligenes TaxID=43263 RepID=A0A1N6SNM1_AQUAC|nr:TetR/AcrR family transcriptional regulator [Pseudomonas alcaligenes]SIQ42627.1 transcriptional regulator, TetR family [Pseudomonas alcaligenes]